MTHGLGPINSRGVHRQTKELAHHLCRHATWNWLSSAYYSGRPLCSARVAYAKYLPSSGVSRYLAEAYMETARQFITFTAVSKAGRNGALGCWLPSIPRRIMAVVVTAALAPCALCFAPTVFAQPASDTLGELLVGKAAFGDWRTDAPLVRRKITDLPQP